MLSPEELTSPIPVDYKIIKKYLNTGGYENLPDEVIQELLLLIPGYIINLRSDVMDAFYKYKQAKALFDAAYSRAFIAEEGSVDLRKHKASLDSDVMQLEDELFKAEGYYDLAKNLPYDWVEMQQALKRIIDMRYRKG